MTSKSIALLLITSLAFTACSREERATDPGEDASAPAVADSAAQAPPAEQAAPHEAKAEQFTVEDIERWRRGVQAELQAVNKAAEQLAAAQDDEAKMQAMSAAMEMSTTEAGASAAGVAVDRYRKLRNTFADAVSRLTPLELEMDVSQMPEAVAQQMRDARAENAARLNEELPADVIEALRARAVEFRKEDMQLVGERFKVANAAR